jgi:hypothetical protein
MFLLLFPTKDSSIEALQSDDQTSRAWFPTVADPMRCHNLCEHVKTTVQILRVRDFHTYLKVALTQPVSYPQETGFIRRHIAHATFC